MIDIICLLKGDIMLASLYLIMCAVFGITLTVFLVPDVRRLYLACAPSRKIIDRIPNSVFIVPAGITLGLLCVPFFNYFAVLGLSYFIRSDSLAMKAGLIATAAFFLWMTLSGIIMIARRRARIQECQSSGEDSLSVGIYHFSAGNAIIYGAATVLFTAFAAFLMFYTYRIEGSSLLVGYSVFSDLSPHTAMVSSFGVGFNFPTQYMHFSGDGIQYHFLFYFLCGMLEYLGFPIDTAINVPSVIVMVCALVLVGLLSVLLSGRRLAFVLAPVLVLFRSSLNVFVHLRELTSSGLSFRQAAAAILSYDQWYGVTDYDNWGIWAINVYPNQRHLMLGISVLLILIILFIPFLRRMLISIGKNGIKALVAGRNAWLVRSGDPLRPWSVMVLACIFTAVMPYFHGSCLIAFILILVAMAVFSESRLIHIIVASVAVISSFAQTAAFSGGASNVVSLHFMPGFILTDKSLGSITRYLVIISGLTLILALVCAVIFLVTDIIHKRPVYRAILFLCFLTPGVFAFLFQITNEILANHKYIQITMILSDVFVAILLSELFLIPFKRRRLLSSEENGAGIESEEAGRTADSVVSAGTGTSEAADAAEGGNITVSGFEEISEAEEVSEPDGKASVPDNAPDTDCKESEVIFGDEAGGVRPGNIALKEEAADSPAFVFGDEEPVVNDTSPAVKSDKSETADNPSSEQSSIGTVSHEAAPAAPLYSKGLSPVAWIALEICGVILALALLVPLTATGISEWATYINYNKDPMIVNTDSPLTEWVISNTDPSDVFLTPMWSMNRFILAGRPMYYGWPYYAWSVGHDTYTRDTIYCWLLTGCNGNIDEFTRYCKERGIKYLIADPEFDTATFSNGIIFNRDFFAANLKQAAYFAEEGTTIYQIY